MKKDWPVLAVFKENGMKKECSALFFHAVLLFAFV